MYVVKWYFYSSLCVILCWLSSNQFTTSSDHIVSLAYIRLMSLVCTGLILEDWIWYLTYPTLQITKFTTKMTCLYKKWLVNYILMSLDEDYLAVYLTHSTAHNDGRLDWKGSRGFHYGNRSMFYWSVATF